MNTLYFGGTKRSLIVIIGNKRARRREGMALEKVDNTIRYQRKGTPLLREGKETWRLGAYVVLATIAGYLSSIYVRLRVCRGPTLPTANPLVDANRHHETSQRGKESPTTQSKESPGLAPGFGG